MVRNASTSLLIRPRSLTTQRAGKGSLLAIFLKRLIRAGSRGMSLISFSSPSPIRGVGSGIELRQMRKDGVAVTFRDLNDGLDVDQSLIDKFRVSAKHRIRDLRPGVHLAPHHGLVDLRPRST